MICRLITCSLVGASYRSRFRSPVGCNILILIQRPQPVDESLEKQDLVVGVRDQQPWGISHPTSYVVLEFIGCTVMTDSLHKIVMNEQRRAERDGTNDARITTFIELSDGTKLEGVAKDISDGGLRISGPTEGLKVGEEIDLILVVLEDQKVHYRALVKHIDRREEFYGLQFRTGPQPVEERPVMWCKRCRREFPGTANFCPACGSKLQRR